MPINILMVAEKPAAAKAVAEGLSNNTATKSNVGRGVPTWEYDGRFKGKAASFRVTSTTGHIFERDFSDTNRSWGSDPVLLFDANTVKREAKGGPKLVSHLQAACKGCSYLILWLDCDREGENICFEVIDVVQKQLIPLNGETQIFRAKFSSLDGRDLKSAMDTLVLPDENVSKAVDARQEIDLKIGVAFTRFQTKYFQEKYGDLNATVLSYGPCQTPTLNFCVSRYDEIINFSPEEYFRVEALIKIGESELTLRHMRGNIFDETVANAFKSLLEEDRSHAVVTSVKCDNEYRKKVLPLDTCTLLKTASSVCGIGPHQAMQIAERLYLSQIITYPRTETSSYPSSYEALPTIKLFEKHPVLGEATKELLNRGLGKPRSGVDVHDHPPITPLRLVSRTQLDNESEYQIYELICKHFLASFSYDCQLSRQTVTVEISKERFQCIARKLVDKGFTAFIPAVNDAMQYTSFTNFRNGDRLPVSKIVVSKHYTTAPPYLSESDLIELMRQHGIGTDASIPAHINNIQQRNYVSLVANRRLEPTKLGIALIHGFQSVDRELILPHVRASIESSITVIAEGNALMETVVQHSLEMFKRKFNYFVENVNLIDNLFEVSFTRLIDSGSPFSRCGYCKRFMILVPKEPIRLFCKHCDATYRMPSGGSIKLYQELKCPLDDFELVTFSVKGGKTFPLCPLCYCFPPFESYDGSNSKMNCLQCKHPTCPHSYVAQEVTDCFQENCNGLLCLEASSKPKWKMECNCCALEIKFFENAKKVSLTGKKCDSCGFSIFQVSYPASSSPWKDGSSEKVGCIECDDDLKGLVLSSSFSRSRDKRMSNRRGRRGGHRHHSSRNSKVDVRMTFDRF